MVKPKVAIATFENRARWGESCDVTVNREFFLCYSTEY